MSDQDRWFSKDFLVGVFVASGIALFVGFMFTVGSLGSYFRSSKTIKVKFDYLGGLKENQPVLYAGYQVGTVQSVNIRKQSPVIVINLTVPSDLPVYQNSDILIASSGLIGDKVVEILPPETPGELVKDGGTVKGESPVSMAKMLGKVRNVFEGGEGSKANGRTLFENVNSIAANFAEMSRSFRELATRSQDQLNTIIGNLSTSSTDFNRVMNRLDTTAVSLNRFADDMSKISSQNKKDLRMIVGNLRKTSKTLQEFTSNNKKEFNGITKNLYEGSGHLTSLVQRADSTAASLNSLARQLSSSSNKDNPEIRQIIKNLNDTSRNLEVFSEKIQDHPWRLIWSE